MISASNAVSAWAILCALDLVCLIGAVEAHREHSDAGSLFFCAGVVISLTGGMAIIAGLHR